VKESSVPGKLIHETWKPNVAFLRLTTHSTAQVAPTPGPTASSASRSPTSGVATLGASLTEHIPSESAAAETATHVPLTLETVYDAYAPFVWRSLQRMGVPESDLEDAMQELFLVVHRKLPSYQESKAKLSTWMFGIGINIARRHRAKASRRFFLAEPDLEVSPVVNQETELSQKQDTQCLNDLLSRLRPEHAATFVMFELEGMTCAEIADLTGVPVGTVYSRLHNAREHFRALLVKHNARNAQREAR
jgi:RNA polymerase sigma-70 factor, ECF subfamily